MFRLVIFNEIRDLLVAIYPPAEIRDQLKGATSLTAILAIFGFILCALSVVFSLESYISGFAEYLGFRTAEVWGYCISVSIALFMTIVINLFAHNVAEGVFRHGKFNLVVTIACLVSGVAIGFYDMKRMQVGGTYIAENMAGNVQSLERGKDSEYLRQRSDLEYRAAQSLAVAAWDSQNNCGGKVVKTESGSYRIVSRISGKPIAISGPGVNATTRKAHADHDRLQAQIQALDERQRQKEQDFRTAAIAANADRSDKLSTLSGTFSNVTTYLYGLQLVLALFQFSILVSAAKSSNVELTGFDPKIKRKDLNSPAPSVGFAQAHMQTSGQEKDGRPTGAMPPSKGLSMASQDGFVITCANCGKVCTKQRANARFCSDKCRKEYHNFSLKKS